MVLARLGPGVAYIGHVDLCGCRGYSACLVASAPAAISCCCFLGLASPVVAQGDG